MLLRQCDNKEKQSKSHSDHILLFSEGLSVTLVLVPQPLATQSSSTWELCGTATSGSTPGLVNQIFLLARHLKV